MTRGRPGARELIAAAVDADSWTSWDEPIPARAHGTDPDYLAALERARAKAGTDEAVLTGRARIQGHPVALVVSEFAFLGGSVGRATGQRITAAVRRATAEGLPLIAATASGGTRMQEGTPAFVTMIDISRAVVAHKAAGLPYLVYLRHPTTGGVFASWGSLGHIAVAEPGALIGFLGPVVYEALNGRPFPPGVQVAENLRAKGIIDAVAPVDALPTLAARALTLLTPAEDRTPERPPWAAAGSGPRPSGVSRAHTHRPGTFVPDPDQDAWRDIELTRRPDRPGVRDLLRVVADDVIPLTGTQEGEAGDALFTALAAIDGRSCVIVGQDRRTQLADVPLGPAALRSARRGMRMADELGLPLVCVIDTPGADLSADAEEGALASEIARCLADLVALRVPTVSVILGEGCGGGALALLPARRVIVAEHGWLSPLPPEGASAILFGDTSHAPQLARQQRIRSVDLLAGGTAHVIVPERPAAHLDPEGFCRAVGAEIGRQIGVQT
ncbi:carboxyl transferase domain-containing protein [Enemella evansiae]|uniref:carboxyl transferase domain-containing protein n=1 Tax=Enemella evansiae TaxID=2016499 RepID=UPI000B95F869|nr:carboxyl transferase domain-containing protein [Enemella evansiae]OYO05499.1 acetyl-CoA carboxyl transferase [Enemella evansiae]